VLSVCKPTEHLNVSRFNTQASGADFSCLQNPLVRVRQYDVTRSRLRKNTRDVRTHARMLVRTLERKHART